MYDFVFYNIQLKKYFYCEFNIASVGNAPEEYEEQLLLYFERLEILIGLIQSQVSCWFRF